MPRQLASSRVERAITVVELRSLRLSANPKTLKIRPIIKRGWLYPPPPHHHGGGWVVLGGQNQNLREVALLISALTGCSLHDLHNVLWNILRITYIYL